MLLALLLSLSAQAAGPEVWSSLYDGRLSESADRDPQAASAIYEALLNHLPDDDLLRSEVLVWLGSARWSAADASGARQSLLAASEDPAQRERARTLLTLIEARKRRVRAIPLRTGFEEDVAPFARGWTRGSPDDLYRSEITGEDGSVLAWRTVVREGEDDFIFAAIDELRSRLTRVKLVLRSLTLQAHVRILLEDSHGERWTAPVVEVPIEDWLELDLPVTAFAPETAPAAELRVDPSHIRSLVLRDVTSFHTEDRGQNTLLVDTLELR